MFFDVRPRLKAGPWVRRVAIGLPVDEGPSVETLLLLYAWKRGPAVIRPWLDYLQHQAEGHDLGTDLGRRRALIEHLIRVQQLPFQAQVLHTLWRLCPFLLGKSFEFVPSTTVSAAIWGSRERLMGELAPVEAEDRHFSVRGGSGQRENPPQDHEDRVIVKAG